MSQSSNTQAGIALMIATTFVFALQDGISRHLASEYNTIMVVMIRYWFFSAFVITISARRPGGLSKVMRTEQPILQALRGALLALEICVMVYAFTLVGLIPALAVFTAYPLLVAALSGPVLGEPVGWRRWGAIGIGFVGVLIILNPSSDVFTLASIVPFCAALLFALYGLLTRYAARKDPAPTSFFWTGTVGAVVMTLAGIWTWEPMSGADWIWMSSLCVSGALGHWLLIKCYEIAEASAVQPFAYLQFVFGAALAMAVFGETMTTNITIGAGVVIAAGLFTLWRERVANAE
jgi:drug/metabolite transporter (DMT)-like permease